MTEEKHTEMMENDVREKVQINNLKSFIKFKIIIIEDARVDSFLLQHG
jgi:hypothetical protein